MHRIAPIAVGCLMLFVSACSGTTESNQSAEELCEEARAHVKTCTGEAPARKAGSCDRETASKVLDQSCEDIEQSSSNKRDGLVSSTLCKLSIGHCKFRSLHSGYGFTCGLKADGNIKCWKRQDGDRKELATPEEVRFKALSAGIEHICGIQTDSEWYENTGYCLKLGEVSMQESAADGRFEAIEAGPHHNCALTKRDREIECWGRESLRNEAPLEVPSGEFKDVAAGRGQSCGVRPNGRVECWGANPDFAENIPRVAFESVELSDHRQYGCGIVASDNDAGAEGVVCWGTNDINWPGEPTSGEFYRVSLGAGFACGITRDADLTCWGKEIIGMTEAPDGEFAGIGAGRNHFCALDQDDGTPSCQWPSLDL